MRIPTIPVILVAALLSACAAADGRHPLPVPAVSAPLAGHVGDRSLLAGEWEYEDGAILTLRLDEQGNGTYAWKDGHFETQVLDGHRWQGLWMQRENDREGGFTVELSPDYTEGEGRWWYTRIGANQAPTEKGGTFHLTRKSTHASLSDTPPAP
ncbi:MAG: hypothetical protein RI101_09900 [Nitrospira sp.]|jgi:hypothetical protein|nr:hypothetical protein [Nitrospira sp.]